MIMQQTVLSKILDCGYGDLELLENIEYDLDDIIQDCINDGDLSLHGIFCRVFWMGDWCTTKNGLIDKVTEDNVKELVFLLNGSVGPSELRVEADNFEQADSWVYAIRKREIVAAIKEGNIKAFYFTHTK